MSSNEVGNTNEENNNKNRPDTPEKDSRKGSKKNTLNENEKLHLLSNAELIAKLQKEENEHNIQKEKLLNKIEEQKIELKTIKSTMEDRIDKIKTEYKRELEKKEKNLKAVSETNKKLIENLEVLNEEVAEKLDKGSIFKKAELKMKTLNSPPKKENQLEILVKVKEKELQNMNQMFSIVKRDKDLLEREKIDKKEHPFLIAELQDKLKYEEKKSMELQNELKTLEKYISNGSDDKKRHDETKEKLEKERKLLRDELAILKDKIKSQNSKQREDESARNLILIGRINDLEKKTKKLQTDLEDLRFTIDLIKQKNPELASTIETNLNKTIKNRESEKEKEKNVNKDNKDNKGAELTKHQSVTAGLHKRNLSQSQEIRKMINKSYSSINLNNNSFRSTSKNLDHTEQKIFNDDEKAILEKIISKEEVEKYEKRFIALEHAKNSIENKAKLDVKSLKKKLMDNEQQLEYINLLFKETDQKNKILQHQLNESKVESKSNNRKSLENTQNIEHLSKLLKERDQENKILLHKLNTLKKLSKHNALVPLGVKTEFEMDSNSNNMNTTKEVEMNPSTERKDRDHGSNEEILSKEGDNNENKSSIKSSPEVEKAKENDKDKEKDKEKDKNKEADKTNKDKDKKISKKK